MNEVHLLTTAWNLKEGKNTRTVYERQDISLIDIINLDL